MKLMKKVSDQLIGSYVEVIHIQNCLEFSNRYTYFKEILKLLLL
jgi:hypothetical protein